MKRIEVNVLTGERKEVELTPDELAEIASRPSPPPAPVPTKAEIVAELAALTAKVNALA